uniref:(northern house mosquito) hypothetical protein n=1 Tax=Culex pipiens TaxID=7175 RepID=A0A8D8JE70_CULPI
MQSRWQVHSSRHVCELPRQPSSFISPVIMELFFAQHVTNFVRKCISRSSLFRKLHRHRQLDGVSAFSCTIDDYCQVTASFSSSASEEGTIFQPDIPERGSQFWSVTLVCLGGSLKCSLNFN